MNEECSKGLKSRIKHFGHRRRMFKKLESYGLSSFNTHQAIEVLLYFIIPRIDTNVMAHRLEFGFKSVENLLYASSADLLDGGGLGEKSRGKLLCMGKCFQTFMHNAKFAQLISYEALYDFCMMIDVQKISVAVLDDKLRVQSVQAVALLNINSNACMTNIDCKGASYYMLIVPFANRIDIEMLDKVEFYQKCFSTTGLKPLDTLLICNDEGDEKTLVVAVSSESYIIDSYVVTKDTFSHTKLYESAKRQDDVAYDVFN